MDCRLGQKSRQTRGFPCNAGALLVFVQLIGRILSGPFQEEWGRLGWEVSFSVLPDGTAGVLALVRAHFARTYGLSLVEVQPGFLFYLRSSKLYSFALVNTYFSPYGQVQRKLQHEFLAHSLTAFKGACLRAGYENRVNEPNGKGLYKGDKDQGTFAPFLGQEAQHFAARVAGPLRLTRASGGGVHFPAS